MIVESYEHGAPCWVNVITPDPAKAAEFYTSVFGWECRTIPGTGGFYVCHLDGQPVAGMGPQMTPDAPVAWVTYVNVTDVDELLPVVSQAGGHLLAPPFEVPSGGRMAVFADPAGGVLTGWQARQHKGAGIVGVPGAYCWSELISTDVTRSAQFYASVFGWVTSEQVPGYSLFTLSGRPIAGLLPKPPTLPAEVPSYWMTYFGAADVDRTAAAVAEAGGSVLAGPADSPAGRFAVVSDLFGATFGLRAV